MIGAEFGMSWSRAWIGWPQIGHAEPVHHNTVAETLTFFPIWVLFNVGFFFVGFHTIRNKEKTARFFNSMGRRMYGKKVADRVYAPGNLLYAAWPFVILTPIGAGFGIYEIVNTLVTGLPA